MLHMLWKQMQACWAAINQPYINKIIDGNKFIVMRCVGQMSLAINSDRPRRLFPKQGAPASGFGRPATP